MQPRWKDPMQTPEGELLQIVKQLEKNIGCSNDKMDSAKPDSVFHGSPMMPKDKDDRYKTPKDMERNPYERERRGDPDRTKPGDGNPFIPKEKEYDDSYPSVSKRDKKNEGEETGSYKSDRGEKEPPHLKGGKGNKVKIDKTTEFLQSKGIMTKWEQEPDNQNSVPTFMAHSGGIPVEAINYHTNGTMPFYTEKAPSISPISEKAKIPAFAKTSYDEKGSSLHMHLNNAGEHDNYNYRSTVEESMMQLKKAGGYGNPGLVEQIASELEVLMSRL